MLLNGFQSIVNMHSLSGYSEERGNQIGLEFQMVDAQ